MTQMLVTLASSAGPPSADVLANLPHIYHPNCADELCNEQEVVRVGNNFNKSELLPWLLHNALDFVFADDFLRVAELVGARVPYPTACPRLKTPTSVCAEFCR